MSYTVHTVAGASAENSTARDDSYQVTDAGVLRLISRVVNSNKLIVTEEFSPQAWLKVTGTRFEGNPEELEGNTGKYNKKTGLQIRD
ncbi:hypothetical protein ACX8Z9_04520 [Arthrobacter halodurans]|uniref:Uncharacterized protein n=1 Tax=Arthrobacter halodurans TaxID=516699 RepID=A0ABV4UR11_9MICC